MTFANLGSNLAKVDALLGCPLNEADKLIQHMIMLKPRPQWLQGMNRMDHLPRYTPWTPHADNPTISLFPIPVIRQSLIAERVVWIIEFLGGPWGIGSESIFFIDPQDGFSYRMRWTA
ncbi:MAG: hypothetical protein EOP83_13440 [Verrucomicrobiaceae bacterium]|nr:MAG: hypothetical protein EOP83_13440 [Verrucomicrobiaceae bacterium]